MFARYMITDRRAAGGTEALLRLIARRLSEGVEYVQIREKDLEARELSQLTRAVMTLPRGASKIIVNSRMDVALAAGADGVHLPDGSPDAGHWQAICPPGFLFGVSCHTVEQVRQARAGYCLFAPVFAPLSKPDSRVPHGLEGLRAAVSASHILVFALGGIERENIGAVRQTGAAGVAGISLFL